MKCIAVMPAYHEATRIQEAIASVQPHVDAVLVVDDGSLDATADRARAAGAIVVRHAVNRGQGAALKTGTEGALRLGADIILHVDADGQHSGDDIPALIDLIRRGVADVVLGSRFMGIDAEGMPTTRRALMYAIRTFNVFVLGVSGRLTDPQSGMRAIHKDAVSTLSFTQDGMAHASEILRLLTRSSLRWEEVPIHVRYTRDTLQKGNKTSDAFRIVWKLFLGAFQR